MDAYTQQMLGMAVEACQTAECYLRIWPPSDLETTKTWQVVAFEMATDNVKAIAKGGFHSTLSGALTAFLHVMGVEAPEPSRA